jgi:myo-inositol-1(or 4)-monophosphatase
VKDTLVQAVTSAGTILLEHFGRVRHVRVKENQSSVVTEADLASEAHLLERIRNRFPQHNLLAEESGFHEQGSDYTWVVDPLDGTSNFAAGLPWFGVMAAVLERGAPILGALYLPVEDALYVAARGSGAWRNGAPVSVTAEADLAKKLCACAMDPCAEAARLERQARLHALLVNRVRNVRATNCLLDFAYTIDGRLGAAINLNTKIWDIAAIQLVLREAGGLLTDLQGEEIELELGANALTRNYAVIGTSPALLSPMLEVVRASGLDEQAAG